MPKNLRWLLCFAFSLSPLAAADPPQVQITNGLVQAKLYLPDATNGFYRGTRFDWSGVISSLDYKSHSYFGQWFTKYDPAVRDVEYDPAAKGYAAGRHSASLGPVEEFVGVERLPLGYAEAAAGGTFIKIGVGVLRKPAEEGYSQYNNYEMADPGKWTVRSGPDHVEFVHDVRHGDYGYLYRKTVRLAAGKPEMVLEHELRNTGRRLIETSVYNHNFFVIDQQPSGPDFSITFPFALQTTRPMEGFAAVEGNHIRFLKVLENDDRASAAIEGFGDSASDYSFRVENRKTGAGVSVRGDKPLSRILFWTIASVFSPETFHHMRIEPGQQESWNLTYEFYTLPASAGH
jgi:hypothetical protein